jgi:cytosine/adenosine deaminase-related metal-dependent hydrolase
VSKDIASCGIIKISTFENAKQIMRYIAANYVFPVTSAPLKNGIVVLENNTIIEIIDTQGKIKEIAGMEFYNGVLIPGFVNAHCHLELSYLKDQIVQPENLADFITQIRKKRKNNLTKSDIKLLVHADNDMFAEGISAIGDISNNDISFELKTQSPVFYHTFIEIFGLAKENVQNIISRSLNLYQSITKQCHASVVPHAAYSVSPELFAEINRLAKQNNSMLSMHNQESKAENELFMTKSGTIYETVRNLQIDMSDFRITGKTSLQSVLHHFPKDNNLLLVHNIYTNETDIDHTIYQDYNYVFWVLCPKSNLLIQKCLPDIHLFRRKQVVLCLGTDSLASNNKLSILEEMITIKKFYPQIEFIELLNWATINGAKALNIADRFGSLEVGKTPGIALIEHFDFRNMCLSENSKARRIA